MLFATPYPNSEQHLCMALQRVFIHSVLRGLYKLRLATLKRFKMFVNVAARRSLKIQLSTVNATLWSAGHH